MKYSLTKPSPELLEARRAYKPKPVATMRNTTTGMMLARLPTETTVLSADAADA